MTLENLIPFEPQIRHAPRNIHPAETFAAMMSWVRTLITEKKAPGFIVGLSGTDSILAFLACARAFALEGRPERVMGVHFGAPFPPPGKTPAEIEKILSLTPSYRWFARIAMPWLAEHAPGAQLVVESDIDYTDDYQRWSSLLRSSLGGAIRTEMPVPGTSYWVVGTRNATEEVLFTYSNISKAVSLQPIRHLWKSEVLKICAALDVPDFALAQSRQVDCDCGRFDIAADNIDEVDAVLMAREGLLSRAYLHQHMTPELIQKLEAFVDEQIASARFKKDIPYIPPAGTVKEV